MVKVQHRFKMFWGDVEPLQSLINQGFADLGSRWFKMFLTYLYINLKIIKI